MIRDRQRWLWPVATDSFFREMAPARSAEKRLLVGYGRPDRQV
jgi:hypothetical protein